MDNDELLRYIYMKEDQLYDGQPNIRDYGLTPYIVNEFIEKKRQLSEKWSKYNEENILISCCISCFLIFPLVSLISDLPGTLNVFIIILHVGLFFGISKLVRRMKNQEYNAIRSKLIDNYIDALDNWHDNTQKEYNRTHNLN